MENYTQLRFAYPQLAVNSMHFLPIYYAMNSSEHGPGSSVSTSYTSSRNWNVPPASNDIPYITTELFQQLAIDERCEPNKANQLPSLRNGRGSSRLSMRERAQNTRPAATSTDMTVCQQRSKLKTCPKRGKQTGGLGGCPFCKSNNEMKAVMTSHSLKAWDPPTNKYKVTCPILREYKCPKCGATGDDAHTITYCPEVIREAGGRPKSLIFKLKNTVRDSCGRVRRP